MSRDDLDTEVTQPTDGTDHLICGIADCWECDWVAKDVDPMEATSQAAQHRRETGHKSILQTSRRFWWQAVFTRFARRSTDTDRTGVLIMADRQDEATRSCPGCDEEGDEDAMMYQFTDQRLPVEVWTCPNRGCRVREYYAT